MNILHTNKAYAEWVGGIETVVTELAEGMARVDGNAVEALVCSHVNSWSTVRRSRNGVSVTYVPRWGTLASLPMSPAFFPSFARARADILHVHEPFPLVDLAMALRPSIASHFSRIVVSWYSDIIRQRWALPFYGPVIHRFLRSVDRILVSVPSLIDNSEFLLPHRERCEVIPLGVKLDWVHHRDARAGKVAAIRQQYGTPLVLFVGRLVYYKGVEYLIEAMSMLPDARLVMIGSGPLKSLVEAGIARYHLQERVTVIPYAEPEDLYAFYEACDLLVLPSTERSETYGLVQVEAMACGKPVVSTNITTGVPFVNQHGKTGFTVPPRDVRALVGALEELIRNTDLARRFGEFARQRALQEFSAEIMVERTMKVYQDILSSERIRR
jgi:glycosyltransferase involved in cell wall biosynthesis